jgi:hypothetical protein
MFFRKPGLSVCPGQRGGLQETSGPAPQESIPHSGNECINIPERNALHENMFLKSTMSLVIDSSDIAKRFTAENSVVDVVFDYIMISRSAKEP